MEILETTQLMVTPWWLVAAIIVIFGDFFVAFVVVIAQDDNKISPILIILILIMIAAGCVIVFAPSKIPSGQMSYTIEITDPMQYKFLVEKGYSFTRMFENKEIYTIIGDVLP